MGFFDPARASEALACMEMMDFEGKAAVMERIRAAAGFSRSDMQADTGGFSRGGMQENAAGLAGRAAGAQGAQEPLRAAVLRAAALAEGKQE